MGFDSNLNYAFDVYRLIGSRVTLQSVMDDVKLFECHWCLLHTFTTLSLSLSLSLRL